MPKPKTTLGARAELAQCRSELTAAKRRIADLEDLVSRMREERREAKSELREAKSENADREALDPPKKRESDFLYGYPAIGLFLGLKARQVQHRVQSKQLPVFRQGRIPCATKSALRAWLAKQMQAAEGGL